MSPLILEPSNFVEVARLPADFEKTWLKENRKKYLIIDQTFLLDDSEKGEPVISCMDVHKAKIQYDGSLDKLRFVNCSKMRLVE